MDGFKWVLLVLEYLVARSALAPESLQQQPQKQQQQQQLGAARPPRYIPDVDWRLVRPPCSRYPRAEQSRAEQSSAVQ